MRDFLQLLLDITIPLFALSSMASVGVGHEPHEVMRPFRQPLMLVTALLANFVAVPLLAILLIGAFNLPQPYAIGLFLVGCAAGAPFLIALARMARVDTALAGGHLLILLPGTIVFMPLVIPRALPDANVPVLAIAQPLLLTMLLPLVLGGIFRWRFRERVPKVMPILQQGAKYLLIVLMAATVAANLPSILSLLTTPAVPAAALLLLGALLIGFLGSVPGMENRVVLALGTGQRNIAAAMIVASSSLEATEPLLMVVVSSLVGFAVLFPAARLLRSRMEKRAKVSQVRFESPEADSVDRKRRA